MFVAGSHSHIELTTVWERHLAAIFEHFELIRNLGPIDISSDYNSETSPSGR